MKAIRGAITTQNTTEDIACDTVSLLQTMMEANNIAIPQIHFVLFSCTRDINADYPAVSARSIGFGNTPLFCVQEMDVVGSMPKCIRILMYVDTDCEIKNIYLKDAKNLRKDLI